MAGFNYTQRKQPNIDCGPVAWCSHITPVDTPGSYLLDLLAPADRLAAIELAQVSSIVHDVLARKDSRYVPPQANVDGHAVSKRSAVKSGAGCRKLLIGPHPTAVADYSLYLGCTGSTGSRSRSCSRQR